MNYFLTYKEACERNMTFADVIKHYKPDADQETIDKWLISAEDSCALKYMSLHAANVVPEIYYVSGEFLKHE